MLFPGRKLEVIDSNVRGSTGPIPGSQGYVSDFYGDPNWTDFRKIVWFKYGKNGKLRIEKGPLLVVSKTAFNQDNVLKNAGRRVGYVEFIDDRRNYKDPEMPVFEFLAWAVSLLRLPMLPHDEVNINSYLHDEFLIGGPNPRRNVRKLAQIQAPWGKMKVREALVDICRDARAAHYKYKQVQIKQSIERCELRIKKLLSKESKYKGINYTPEQFVSAVNKGKICLPGKYTEFCRPFHRDALLLPRMDFILRDSSKWIKAFAKDWAEKYEKSK